VVAAFVRPGAGESTSLVENLQRLSDECHWAGSPLRCVVVFTGGGELAAGLEGLAARHAITIPLDYALDGRLPTGYRISPLVSNTILQLRDHRVLGNFTNVDGRTFDRIEAAVRGGFGGSCARSPSWLGLCPCPVNRPAVPPERLRRDGRLLPGAAARRSC
jgi:hypothetical protein